MEEHRQEFSVITGASQGLGKAFAIELAKRKRNLILISLPDQQLHETALRITEKYGIRVICFETDLSQIENVLSVTNEINCNYKVDLLINNAGLGGSRKILDASSHYINTIIQVNVMATSIMTRQLLPNLMKNRKAYILNVSSLAAFSPIGYKTVYPASKSFVRSFSLGLSEELRDTAVQVSVVNPGPMRTSKEIIERIEKQGLKARLSLLDPEKVAYLCIQGLFNGKHSISVNPFSTLFMSLLPEKLRRYLITNAVKNEVE